MNKKEKQTRQENTKFIDLSREQSIELLYNHYKWWLDNNMNCKLINYNNKVVAIQINSPELPFFTLKGHFGVDLDYIIVNNKKKIERAYFNKLQTNKLFNLIINK